MSDQLPPPADPAPAAAPPPAVSLQPPPPAAKRRPRWATPAIALAAFVVGAGAAGASGDSTTTAKPTTTVTVTATAAAEPAPAASTSTTTEAAAPADYVPQPKDFRVTLSIISKQCFGSAGCNITYRIAPKYIGPAVSHDLNLTVTYQVDGGEDGPQINSFTIEDNTASFDQQEVISTKSSKSKLSVKVTQVLEN